MIVTHFNTEEEGPNKWLAWRDWTLNVYGTGPTEGEAVENLKEIEEERSCASSSS